jgi:hypothetical protein
MTKLAAATVQMIWLTVAILLVALAGLGLSVIWHSDKRRLALGAEGPMKASLVLP